MNEEIEPELLPFPTILIKSNSYKTFGIVTNITAEDIAGDDVINCCTEDAVKVNLFMLQ